MIEQIGDLNLELMKSSVRFNISEYVGLEGKTEYLNAHQLTLLIKFCNKALIQIAKNEQ
jgi:hypothetical protein